MKTSTKFAILAFGAASLSAVMTPPAFAGDCKDVVGITNFLQCFTRPPDPSFDAEANLKRDGDVRVKTTTYSARGTDNNGHSYQARRYSDGSGDYQERDPKTGITSIQIRNADGTITRLSSFRDTMPGRGGSGGRHGSAN